MKPEITRDEQGRWMVGASGNPLGRPSGTGHVARLRAELAQQLPGIIESLVRQAKAGDIGAIRVVLDRVIPPLKAVDAPLSLQLPEGGFTTQGRAIVASAASGEVSAQEAAQLVAAISNLARVEVLDELERKVQRLEQA
ncbi:MAG: hypothetical protein FJY46_06660 [Betaproteobacteria bacterium]|nr:hypothetical protein [Betaproteobacteria bacterium]